MVTLVLAIRSDFLFIYLVIYLFIIFFFRFDFCQMMEK